MNRLETALRDLAGELDRSGRSWCLVGGLAVSARTNPRFTRDIDVAISVPDDRSAERLIHGLLARGYRPLASIEQQAAGRLATMRLVPPQEDPSGVITDLLFSSSGIEPEVASGAEKLEIYPGLLIPVASIAALIALKLLAQDDERRPQDRMDLRSLFGVADEAQLADVLRLIRLIADRGCNRGKDLLACFEKAKGVR